MAEAQTETHDRSLIEEEVQKLLQAAKEEIGELTPGETRAINVVLNLVGPVEPIDFLVSKNVCCIFPTCNFSF